MITIPIPSACISEKTKKDCRFLFTYPWYATIHQSWTHQSCFLYNMALPDFDLTGYKPDFCRATEVIVKEKKKSAETLRCECGSNLSWTLFDGKIRCSHCGRQYAFHWSKFPTPKEFNEHRREREIREAKEV